MDFTLVVVSPFGLHASGDVITDPAGVAAVLDGEHADKVVRVRRDDVVPVQGNNVVPVPGNNAVPVPGNNVVPVPGNAAPEPRLASQQEH